MKLRQLLVLLAWTVFMMLVTGIFALPLMGNCAGDVDCERFGEVYSWVVFGTAFVIYWTVFILLIRKWNRDVW